jgi:hypothetical protein
MIEFDFAGILRAPLPAFALSFASSSVPRDHQSSASPSPTIGLDAIHASYKSAELTVCLSIRLLSVLTIPSHHHGSLRSAFPRAAKSRQEVERAS